MSLVHGVNLNPDGDMVINHIERTKADFEPESVAFWLNHANGVAVDVGAYTGLYAILAAMRGYEVIAFEPNPHAYQRLLENVARNGVSVNCLNVAASSQIGDASMEVRFNLTSAGAIRIGGGLSVKTTTLDECVKGKVSIIKIDVEGHEPDVLRGAERIIKESKPAIIAEVNDAAHEKAVKAMLPGYSFRLVDKRNLLCW